MDAENGSPARRQYLSVSRADFARRHAAHSRLPYLLLLLDSESISERGEGEDVVYRIYPERYAAIEQQARLGSAHRRPRPAERAAPKRTALPARARAEPRPGPAAPLEQASSPGAAPAAPRTSRGLPRTIEAVVERYGLRPEKSAHGFGQYLSSRGWKPPLNDQQLELCVRHGYLLRCE